MITPSVLKDPVILNWRRCSMNGESLQEYVTVADPEGGGG